MGRLLSEFIWTNIDNTVSKIAPISVVSFADKTTPSDEACQWSEMYSAMDGTKLSTLEDKTYVVLLIQSHGMKLREKRLTINSYTVKI